MACREGGRQFFVFAPKRATLAEARDLGGFEQKMPPPVAVTGERDGVTDTIQFASLEANSLEPELLRTLARRRLGRP